MIQIKAKPLVSIVIPTYNHAEFLRLAIQSIIEQTYDNWEIIIINNYSTDTTVELVEKFKEPRIRLINFNNNGVIATSRNIGIKKSRGEWIAFLDSDDIWYPSKLEKCMSIIGDDKNVTAVCHGERWVYSDNYYRDVRYGPRSLATYDSLLFQGNCISTSAVVVRGTLIEKVGLFSEKKQFITAEDYDLWLKLAKSNVFFAFIPEALGEFRIHPGGNSQFIIKNMNAILSVLNHHYNEIESKDMWKHIRYLRAQSLIFYGAGRGFQKQNNRRSSFKLFFRSMITYPFNSRLYIAMFINLLPKNIKIKVER
ncbi:glycosyltransferase [bacterium]|nr:glycosyltransferase [bacterium]